MTQRRAFGDSVGEFDQVAGGQAVRRVGSVCGHPRSSEIREVGVGRAEGMASCSDDPAVADHQDLAAGVLGGDVGQRRHESLRGIVIWLEPVGSSTFGEVTGPACLDFVARETFPRADVDLAEALVDLDRSDAEKFGDDLGGQPCALKVARPHGIEGAQQLRCCNRLELTGAVERRVGLTLPAADGVPFALAVPHDEQTGVGCSGRPRLVRLR